MKEYRNTLDLDGCNYDVTYLADEEFEKIELVKIESQGSDFTDILTDNDKQRIIERLT